MAQVLPLRIDGLRSWTVADTNGIPVPEAERYLRFLRQEDRSPNTIRAYARGLAEWWTILEATSTPYDNLPTHTFGQYLVYLRTGDLPHVDRIGPEPHRLAPSSVAARAAAVLAFYQWNADATGTTQPLQVLYNKSGTTRRPYTDFLTGVGPRRTPARPTYRIRTLNKTRTPLLTPAQVRTIIDGCATQTDHGTWQPNLPGLRDRFLFALLAETGMRLGEALSLRHCDIHPGAGATGWIDVVPRQDHPHGLRSKSSRDRRIYIGTDLESLYSAYVWELIDAGIDIDIPDLPQHFIFVNVAAQPLFAPMRAESIYARVRTLKRDHPDLPAAWTPHWLRHTHATALLLAGRPPHLVMRRLGHLDIQTTLSIYGWVTEDAEMRTLANWASYVADWKGLHDTP